MAIYLNPACTNPNEAIECSRQPEMFETDTGVEIIRECLSHAMDSEEKGLSPKLMLI